LILANMIIRNYMQFIVRVVSGTDFLTALGMGRKAFILCAFRIYTDSQDDRNNDHPQAMFEKAKELTVVRGCAI